MRLSDIMKPNLASVAYLFAMAQQKREQERLEQDRSDALARTGAQPAPSHFDAIRADAVDVLIEDLR